MKKNYEQLLLKFLIKPFLTNTAIIPMFPSVLLQMLKILKKHYKKGNIGNPLTTSVPHHTETSQFICWANQFTGFYMIGNIGCYWVKSYIRWKSIILYPLMCDELFFFIWRKKQCFVLKIFIFYIFGESINFEICDV